MGFMLGQVLFGVVQFLFSMRQDPLYTALYLLGVVLILCKGGQDLLEVAAMLHKAPQDLLGVVHVPYEMRPGLLGVARMLFHIAQDLSGVVLLFLPKRGTWCDMLAGSYSMRGSPYRAHLCACRHGYARSTVADLGPRIRGERRLF